MQGEAAALEVSAGVRYFNKARNVDVIIVARGGGSAEDLAAFNHEGLARAVAASAIPVISAVGHETDFTIVDFVADLRAPTPSAAAELVIRSRLEVAEQLGGLHRRLEKAMRYQLLMARQSLTELARHGAFARMMDLIHRREQRLDDLVNRLAHAQRDVFEKQRRRFETLVGCGSALRCAARARRDEKRFGCADYGDCFCGSQFAAGAQGSCGADGYGAAGAFSAGNSGAWVCTGVRCVGKLVEGCREGEGWG